MKRLVAAVLPSFWVLSCAGPPPAPEPDARLAARSGVAQELLQRGHHVYLMQCGRCHDHVLPDDVTRADWHVVLPGMAWNAGLDPADQRAVMAYIMATTTP
jgi:cytochrome c5